MKKLVINIDKILFTPFIILITGYFIISIVPIVNLLTELSLNPILCKAIFSKISAVDLFGMLFLTVFGIHFLAYYFKHSEEIAPPGVSKQNIGGFTAFAIVITLIFFGNINESVCMIPDDGTDVSGYPRSYTAPIIDIYNK